MYVFNNYFLCILYRYTIRDTYVTVNKNIFQLETIYYNIGFHSYISKCPIIVLNMSMN